MATWGLRWQVPFKTKDDITMCVNIYDKGYTGTSSYLTAAPDPFTTQEADGNDVFMPIRSQTGYIRVIDDTANGDLLEQMMPVNNTQRMVKVYDGTWSNGIFISSGSVIWQGYMTAQAFTQEWEKEYDLIEFPVNSMLESLKYVQVPVATLTPVYPLARILVEAFGSEYGLDANIAYFRMVSQFYYAVAWYTVRINMNTFYRTIEMHNQGQSYNVTEGNTMYSVLSEILTLFGMTAREKGNDIWFCQYDRAANLRMVTFAWSSMLLLARGDRDASSLSSSVNTADIMTQLYSAGFRGKNNRVSFIHGYNRAQVEFSFNTEGLDYLQLPQTAEDETAISEYIIRPYRLYVQHHEPRVNNYETFTYSVIRVEAWIEEDPETAVRKEFIVPRYYAVSNYNNFKTAFPQDIQIGPDPSDVSTNYIIVGAEPCRWDYKRTDEGGLVTLKNGMLMQLSPIHEPTYNPQVSDFSTDHPVYVLQSASSVSVQTNGYICLSSVLGIGGSCYLLLELQVGSFYWNGTVWTTTRSQFLVSYDANGKIVGSKPDDVDGGDGLYIGINYRMTGTVVLTVHRDTDSDTLYLVMEELSVSYVYKRSAVESERSSNIYVANILQMGFSEDVVTSLTVGTHNNNIPSVSFLLDANNAYIETMSYRENGTEVTERPELNLLDRMVMYYNKVRRTYEAVVRDRVNDIFNCVYTDHGRAFMAVDSDHNWRDGLQKIKFLEVTADNE